ncbi:hypothetical protein IED02_RS27025, partial [Escherichia coli]
IRAAAASSMRRTVSGERDVMVWLRFLREWRHRMPGMKNTQYIQYNSYIQYRTYIHSFSFPGQIRFLVVTDLPLPPHSVTSRQHSMQCLIQLPMALYVVLYLWTVMRRAGAENSDMMIFSGGTLPESRLFK